MVYWTVLDETLTKGLSSNEFLRGRIRKESSLFFFSFFIIFSLIILTLTLLSILSFFQGNSWAAGGPHDNIGEVSWDVRLFDCRKFLSVLLYKVSTITVVNIFMVSYCSLYASKITNECVF